MTKWSCSNTLRLEGEQMSFNAENIPRVFTQKTENPFLIIGNYVELISHYASSIGHEGIQCYQYFRVIKVLLRTHISAGSCAVCFAAKKGLLGKYLHYFNFLLRVFKRKEEKAAQKCTPTLKSKHLFPLDILINADLAALTPHQGHRYENNGNPRICCHVRQDLGKL